MTRFYVFRGKKVLWNLLILVIVVLALVYVFYAEDELETSGVSSELPLEEPTYEVFTESRGGEPVELIEFAEHVTVRAVPTKFSEYRLERERVRSRQMELLQSMIYDTGYDSESRMSAQRELQALIETMTRETEIENLLKAKGYLDGVVILNSEAVTVVVPAALTREEAAGIGELIHRLTGIRLDRVTIVDEPLGV